MSAKARILVVDDHLEMARLLSDQLTDLGYDPEVAGGGSEALERVRTRPFDLVLTDLRMEKVDGFDVLQGVQSIDPALPVLLMTAFGAIDSAIEAMRRGAFHYLTKPFQLAEVRVAVERALEARRLKEENRSLRASAERLGGTALIGESAAMRSLSELLDRIAASSAPVLVRGESGSGKELVARGLHHRSARSERPFVAVNCTALPEQLLESELFGHLKGAFSGATSARRGLFVEADGGTLLLDEIGDMPSELQSKLLRVLQDGQVRPVGADAPRHVDVRVVAATHQDLEAKVKAGTFRADLYYRLNVVPIVVPPLRERPEDIPPLIAHFLSRARQRTPNTRARRFSPELLEALTRSPWPGNVRELENVVERLVIVAPGEEVGLDDLHRFAPNVLDAGNPLEAARQNPIPLKQLESDYIAWVIHRCGGNKTRAAELLGIDVSTIHRKERGR